MNSLVMLYTLSERVVGKPSVLARYLEKKLLEKMFENFLSQGLHCLLLQVLYSKKYLWMK